MRINIQKLNDHGFDVEVAEFPSRYINITPKHADNTENTVGNIMEALGDGLGGVETEMLAYEVVRKHQNRVILALCE